MGAEIVSDDLQNLEMSDVDVDRLDRQDNLTLRQAKQLEFLLTVLQSVCDSNSNPDIIYPLLRQNLDLLDIDIIEVLKNWVTTKFAEIDRDEQRSIATNIVNFGSLIHKFPLRNKAVSMELSIYCCESALKVYTKEALPINWAKIQNNLANAYHDRIKGDRVENLECSMHGYQAALKILTKENSPIQWAMTQTHLAATYSSRLRGNRVENLERSIQSHQAALEVRTRENSPIEWAMTQVNLATAYSQKIKGDRAENLEQSIYHDRSALEILDKKHLPIQWAMTQNNLAITYSERSKRDRDENLERSIDCYRAALEIYTPESFPREWASIQVNLSRFSIEQLQNYQAATEHLQSAYEYLLANNNDTGLLAQTMFELARCFHKTGCLGQAKIYFKDSIRLYQRLEQPTQVAAATSALGNLELQMGCIDDARIHLQTALEFYQAAGNPDRVASIQELQQCLPEHSPEPAL
jgi:tetratricopeptide (TPR) repeat protein